MSPSFILSLTVVSRILYRQVSKVRAVNLASTFCQLSSAQFMISRFGLFSRLSRFGRLHLAISVQPSAVSQKFRNPQCLYLAASPSLPISLFVFSNPKSEIRNRKRLHSIIPVVIFPLLFEHFHTADCR
jgi:hypothetical protein